MKQCRKCSVVKDSSNFYPAKNTKDGLYAWCKDCYLEYAKNRPKRSRSAEDNRRYNLMSTYGITPEEFDAILVRQGGKCATCPRKPNGTSNFHVDHDHSCCPGPRSCGKCVRGILCGNCNKALGFINDDAKVLENLRNYVLQTVFLP